LGRHASPSTCEKNPIRAWADGNRQSWLSGREDRALAQAPRVAARRDAPLSLGRGGASRVFSILSHRGGARPSRIFCWIFLRAASMVTVMVFVICACVCVCVCEYLRYLFTIHTTRYTYDKCIFKLFLKHFRPLNVFLGRCLRALTTWPWPSQSAPRGPHPAATATSPPSPPSSSQSRSPRPPAGRYTSCRTSY